MTEAKDTIMTPQQHSLFQKEFMRGQKVQTYADFMIDKQAEISFKAGYDEGIEAGDYCEGITEGRHIGIKEVVDYLKADMIYGILIDNDRWQAKLKEWSLAPEGEE